VATKESKRENVPAEEEKNPIHWLILDRAQPTDFAGCGKEKASSKKPSRGVQKRRQQQRPKGDNHGFFKDRADQASKGNHFFHTRKKGGTPIHGFSKARKKKNHRCHRSEKDWVIKIRSSGISWRERRGAEGVKKRPTPTNHKNPTPHTTNTPPLTTPHKKSSYQETKGREFFRARIWKKKEGQLTVTILRRRCPNLQPPTTITQYCQTTPPNPLD